MKKHFQVILLLSLAANLAFLFVYARPLQQASLATVQAADKNAKPKASRKTEKDIQSAIDDAFKNGGGDVNIPAGKYYLSATIVIKPTIKLKLDSATMLIPNRNVNVIEMKSNSAINGGIIYAYDMEGYDKSAIYLDGSEQFSGTLKTANISDIKIIGRQGRGNAVHFAASKGNDHVSWVQVNNLNITGFEKAIYFKTEPVEAPGKVWINGNNFSQIFIKDSHYGIYLDGHSDLPYEISGNTFANVQIQTGSETRQAVFVKGTKNYIQAMIWDYHLGAEAIHFDEDSLRNQIYSNVSPNDRAFTDQGKGNLAVAANL